MKKVFFTVAVASLLLASAARAGDNNHDARVAAAKAYLKVVPAEKIVDQNLEGLTKDVRFKLSAKEVADIKSTLDMTEINNLMLDTLAEEFSVEELKEMTRFFGSAAGQSVMRKMPAYMAKVLPSVQQPISKQVTDLMQKKHPQPKTAPAPAAAAQQPKQDAAAPAAAQPQAQEQKAPASTEAEAPHDNKTGK